MCFRPSAAVGNTSTTGAATKPCESCGLPVSVTATECPHCHKPIMQQDGGGGSTDGMQLDNVKLF